MKATKLSSERMAELSAALRAKGRLPVRAGVCFALDSGLFGRVFECTEDAIYWVGRSPGCSGAAVLPGSPRMVQTLDLNDPATVGVLEDYARELWRKDGLYVESVPCEYRFRVWAIYSAGCEMDGSVHDTRVEAWVAAILSAPEKDES